MNIRDDLKTFYVGDRQGTAIYVGSTKVWPINPCNPQIVTVTNSGQLPAKEVQSVTR